MIDGEEMSTIDRTVEENKNLDVAEVKIVGILDYMISMIEHIKDRGLEFHEGGLIIGNTDKNQLIENGHAFMNDLLQIQTCIAEEIPRVVKYVPFERSSYGSNKDADISKQKLAFAKDSLRHMLDQLS